MMIKLLTALFCTLVLGGIGAAQAQEIGVDSARHLLNRTGFSASGTEIQSFSRLTREEAADRLLNGALTVAFTPPPRWINEPIIPPYKLRDMNREEREAVRKLNIERAFELREWWYREMLDTSSPLTEKMTLFWHNHFATSQQKVRFAPLMYRQNIVLRRNALGNFGTLLHEIARDPAMVIYLDSAQNRREQPNENFAREVMELFTMGVGNYSEKDVREGARAFTGWYFDNLAFKVDPNKHDDGPKTFLGQTGNFDGVAALKIIFQQAVTAEYLAGKIYRFLVRDDLSEDLRKELGAVLRDHNYEVKPLLTVIFSSKDFYSQASYGAHIKGPVEHMVAMMKQLGVDAIPGVPDFNQATISMGQHLLNPPSVAGWAGGKAWITPGLLIARGNIARDVLIPDITGFRDWNFSAGGDDILGRRLRDGYDVGAATAVDDPSNMTMFDRAALERGERFNTRISGYVGWEQASRKLIPTPRHAAQFDLTRVVLESGSETTGDAVDYLMWRMVRVPAARTFREACVTFLTKELGTDRIDRAKTYMEDPLRMTLHVIMSTPEYQIV